MDTTVDGGCRLVRAEQGITGKQGLDHAVGISAQSVGARALHLQLLSIQPLGRARAHKHSGHESAIFALRGVSGCWYGERLEHHAWVQAGDFFYIPADMPHLPYNPSDSEDFVALIARTDANDQESVTLLPDLDGLRHIKPRHGP